MTDLNLLLSGNLDTNVAISSNSISQSESAPEPTAGALLRAAREAAGVHIAALAAALKVPVKKLEALEDDRFDLLLDTVFVRALASSVCRTLKLDPTQVLQRLPSARAIQPDYTAGCINTPFRCPGDGRGPALLMQISRPSVLAGLALLLGALVLIFLPNIEQNSVSSRPGSDSALTKSEPGDPVPVAAANEAVKETPAASTEQISPSNLVDSVAASSDPVTPILRTALNGIVTFRAKGESWIEVTDAKGSVLLRRTLTSGETAGVSGALPLTTVVGRADVMQVQIRGQAFDLTAVARDNVARFEVK